jgi:hypothetical protein
MSVQRSACAPQKKNRGTCVLATDRLDDIVWRSSKQLGDDRELVDMVFAGEQRLSIEHFRKNATRAPDVNLHIVLLPREHDFRGTVVARGHITRHLGVLDSRETEIANLEIAVLIDQDVARLQVAVNNAGGVNIFQSALLAVSNG